MANKKAYIITSITLGAIAAFSAGLIGLTNLITKDRIVENEKNKVENGIKEIFGNDSMISSQSSLSDYKYLTDSFVVNKNESEDVLGYAYRTSGSNSYGKISLIVGFKATDFSFIGLSIVVNEQTYASTLEDNYLTPLNEGDRKLEDVTCGATFGAKLVRDMINEASDTVKEMWKE